MKGYGLNTSSDSVTTVGATTSVPEVAVSSFFSSGGFSNYVSLQIPRGQTV